MLNSAIVFPYQLNVNLCKLMYHTLLYIILYCNLLFVMYRLKKIADGLKFYINYHILTNGITNPQFVIHKECLEA